jgi:hypothetical protein
MRSILVIVLISLILFSCEKKKGNQTSSTAITSTVVVNHPLDQFLKDNFDFKNNSYWVYSNTNAAQNLDSIYLKDYQYSFDTIKVVTNHTLTLNVYETIRYNLVDITPTYTWSTVWRMRERVIDHYLSSVLYASYSYSFSSCETENFIGPSRQCQLFKDTITLGNGNQYTNSTMFLNEKDFGVESVGSVPLRTKTIIVPGIGIVSLFSAAAFFTDLQLLRYSLVT